MAHKTQRKMAREKLEARGFTYTAGHGDRYWTMVSPSGQYAFLLGRNGAVRRTIRTARGFPISKSTAYGFGPEAFER